MRTLSAGLTAHVAGTAHTRCFMLRLDLIDGTSIGATDHDQPIAFDLGDGSLTYLASTGILASDVALQIGLDANNYEVSGPIGPLVTLAAILGGRFNHARARLFQVNWQSLGDGAIAILAGSITEARPEGGKFIFEVRSDVDRLNQVVGRTIVNNCSVDFGSTQCGKIPEAIVGTVTAVTSAMVFTVSFTGTYANAYFNQGKVEPLTGANANCAPVEIVGWSAGGALELLAPLPSTPVVGDTFTIKRGCSKLRLSADATIPTCLSYGNVPNFRGFPEVPGSNKVLRATIPGDLP